MLEAQQARPGASGDELHLLPCRERVRANVAVVELRAFEAVPRQVAVGVRKDMGEMDVAHEAPEKLYG